MLNFFIQGIHGHCGISLLHSFYILHAGAYQHTKISARSILVRKRCDGIDGKATMVYFIDKGKDHSARGQFGKIGNELYQGMG